MCSHAGRGVGLKAIVTGAASGIGRTVACSLAADRYEVTAADVNSSALDALREEARTKAWQLTTAVIDVRDRKTVSELCNNVYAEGGPSAAFVHCAGITWRGNMLQMEDADYERVVGINLKGSFICLTAAARALVDRGIGGSLVAITSVNARRPLVAQAVYSASKAAVEVLVQTLAVEVGAAGIRVNAVAAGAVDTPMNPRIRDNTDLARRLPLGRIGTTEDIAEAIRFLLSDAAGYITGASLVVDGGLTQVRTV